MKINSDPESIFYFIKVLSSNELISHKQIASIMSVSDAYLRYNLLNEITNISIDAVAYSKILQLPSLPQILVERLKHIKPQLIYYSKKSVLHVIASSFLLNGNEISLDEAEYLLSVQWFSLKELKNDTDLIYDMQVSRKLDKSDFYIKISSVSDDKDARRSLVRYIKI